MSSYLSKLDHKFLGWALAGKAPCPPVVVYQQCSTKIASASVEARLKRKNNQNDIYGGQRDIFLLESQDSSIMECPVTHLILGPVNAVFIVKVDAKRKC